MKASELVRQLRREIAKRGDREVYLRFYTDSIGHYVCPVGEVAALDEKVCPMDGADIDYKAKRTHLKAFYFEPDHGGVNFGLDREDGDY